ncbi:Npt1/Npt2 family nucleotide transporter [Candidatus Neptunochlamydia vexilliferae]|uniref:ADP,ATP carrier protein n=1 Tax=Candidatus Neptunichlamydia vexilliferae TaxID=1651774 RepID=A0ABS0AYQ7_9BACT|nr:Npt1/Npt2 family nucleotide transporter [Candidatus Neptunochlamydia vexilliferae]MBF5058732.1 ADP,ATP carrier protein 1 [Candidatus Neptunochlamydia vexilliferae]
MTTEFSRWRAFLWPIHRREVKKFVPLLILYALICFNYSLLKAAKDALVITANEAGAAVVPFIKIWVILPMALVVTYLFTRLFNRFSQEKVFYIMIGSFLSFFIFFAVVLYPLHDVIHPHAFCDGLQSICPQGFGGLIAMVRNWSFTLFYVVSELWGTAIMSVLFWAFANEIMTVKDAKRFYGILGVGANISAIFAGQIAILVSGQLFDLSFIFGSDAWGQSLGLVTTIVVFTGLIAMALFRWYHTSVLQKDPTMKEEQVKHHAARKKVKMGMRKNFAYLTKSKYLLCIAVLVIGFNLAINMVEIIWKDQIRVAYPNPNDFNAYMGKVLKAIGFLSTFIAIFISGNMIRRMGWTFSALITPIALLVTGVFFFGFLLLSDHPSLISWSAAMGFTPLALGVLFGTVQNVFSRGCKYTLFDATKEIAFIPLSSESKLKGKAAIDGVGSRLGKTGGSIIHGGLLMVFGSVSLSTPFVGVFLLLVVFGWIVATKSLGRQFNRLTAQDEKLDIEEAAAASAKEPTTQRTSAT